MYAYVSNNPISNTDDDGNSLFKVIRKAVKIAANISFKGVKDKVVNTAKRYIKNKIDGYYQIGKAYVDSKINEMNFRANAFYAEVGVSDPTVSKAISKSNNTLGIYTNKTYKIHQKQISRSADTVLSISPISISKSIDDESTVSKNISYSFKYVELSSEGFFFGYSFSEHHGTVGIDAKLGLYVKWDWFIKGI